MGNAPRMAQIHPIIANPIPNPVPRSQPNSIATNSISMVPDLDLEVHIHKNSFKLSPTETGDSLTFAFDSLTTCFITIYYFGVEAYTKTNDHTSYFGVNEEKFPKPVCYKFKKGLNQTFPEGVSNFKYANYVKEINECPIHNNFPVVVVISPDKPNPYPYESSFLKIELEKDAWKPVLAKQKMHLEEKSYFLNEIYGLSVTNLDENLCVVCFTEKSTVTMLPCKHLCLCADCTKLLSESSVKKCPICRASNFYLDVNEFLSISNE